jgi:hypothetical protein
MIELRPTWKSVNAPGGTHFISPKTYRHETDCPLCGYGTLRKINQNNTTRVFCIDCKYSARHDDHV